MSKRTVVALVVACAFVVAAVTLWPRSTPPRRPTGQSAQTACQESVRGQLKAPSTAKFQPAAAAASTTDPDGWTASGSVDAQNGFGAMIRMTYSCELQYLPGSHEWWIRSARAT